MVERFIGCKMDALIIEWLPHNPQIGKNRQFITFLPIYENCFLFFFTLACI